MNSYKTLHRITGCILAVFIAAHLTNHLLAWWGIENHQLWLERFRKVYRQPVAEIILVLCFAVQVYSGIKLFWQQRRNNALSTAQRLQMYAGLALGLFIIQHIPAAIGLRWYHGFDTNFYFAANVVVQAPLKYYFIPYYFLGVAAAGIHLAATHYVKMKALHKGNQGFWQAIIITIVFVAAAVIILYLLTGGHYPFTIPEVYKNSF